MISDKGLKEIMVPAELCREIREALARAVERNLGDTVGPLITLALASTRTA